MDHGFCELRRCRRRSVSEWIRSRRSLGGCKISNLLHAWESSVADFHLASLLEVPYSYRVSRLLSVSHLSASDAAVFSQVYAETMTRTSSRARAKMSASTAAWWVAVRERDFSGLIRKRQSPNAQPAATKNRYTSGDQIRLE